MSRLFKQSIPVPVGGVSQVAPEVRGPGYADELVNGFPSSARGLGVRQGTETLATGLIAPVPHEIHQADLSPAEDERYTAYFDSNGVRVVNAQTGQAMFVGLHPSIGPFLGTGKFSSAPYGTDLYVVSRGFSKVQTTTSPAPAQSSTVLVRVHDGKPDALYKITLGGTEVSYQTPTDPDNTKRPAIGLVVNTGEDPENYVTVTPSNASVELQPGESTNVEFTLVRGTDFTGDVVLEVTYPSNTSVNFNQNPVPAGSSAFTASVNVGPSCPVGAYTINIVANSDGGLTTGSSAFITLNVVNPDVPPGDYVQVSQNSIPTINAGDQSAILLSVLRGGGFTGPVTLATSGFPAGITAALGTTTVDQGINNTGLSLTVGSGVSPGNYTGTVTATATGVDPYAEIVTFTVAAAPSGAHITLVAASAVGSTLEGGNVDFALTLTRGGGFFNDVTLAFVSNPGGFTVGFTDDVLTVSPLETSTTTLTTAPDPAAAYDTYAITIQATGTGIPTVLKTFYITVRPPA